MSDSGTSDYTGGTSEEDDEYDGKVITVSKVKKGSAKQERNRKRTAPAATTQSARNKTKKPRNAADEPPSYKRVIPLKPDELFVDWSNDRLTSHSRWGQDKLYRYLPVLEMDKLVGWATHMNTYQHPLNDVDSETAARNLPSLPKCSNNPLLGLPNLPLRPSLLKHVIQDPSTKLATSLHQTRSAGDRKRSKSCYLERFQHSAAVALGMLAEEMITASLLPLARRHVARCRQHEDVTEWTLPPEEAIMKLFHDSEMTGEGCSSLLSSRIPTRSAVPGAVGTSILNQPWPGVRAQMAHDAWCRSRAMDPSTLGKDERLFGLLVQMPGAPLPSSAAARIDASPLQTSVVEDSNKLQTYEI